MLNEIKLEVIIFAGEILIQDVTFLRPKGYDYNPILRVPTPKELRKILDCCIKSVEKIS